MTAYRVEFERAGRTYNTTVTADAVALTALGFKILERPKDLVVELGISTPENFGGQQQATDILTGYVARVYDASDTLVHTETVQYHWWYSRWRYQIVPETIKHAPLELWQAGLVAAYKPYPGVTATRPPGVYNQAMSTAGWLAYMGTTGERNEIGLTNEKDVYTLLTGDARPCLDGAEAWNSYPVIVRNERTGKPWDLIANPFATLYGNQNAQNVTRAPKQVLVMSPQRDTPAYQGIPATFYDNAHQPSLLLAVLLTESDFLLETLQYVANMSVLQTRFMEAPFTKAIPDVSQVRGAWWSLSALLNAELATQLAEARGPLADYLLPSSYFTQIIANLGEYFDKFSLNNPAFSVFHVAFGQTYNFPFWQQGFGLMVVGNAIKRHPEWKARYVWLLDLFIQLTSGKSGWPECLPTDYYLWLTPAHLDSPIAGSEKPGDMFDSFGALWRSVVDGVNQAIAGFTDKDGVVHAPDPDGNFENYNRYNVLPADADHTGGGKFLIQDTSYLMYCVQVISQAKRLQDEGVISVPDLDASFANVHLRVQELAMRYAVPLRQSITFEDPTYPATATLSGGAIPIPDPSPTPEPIPVPTPIPEPEPQPGEPPMSNDIVQAVKAEVAIIKSDVATVIAAAHARIAAVIAAAAGNAVDPAELQGPLDDLKALHETLTTEAAALPGATA